MSQATDMTDGQLQELVEMLDAQPLPVPARELELLHATARGDTGGSVGTRAFLFWLVGQQEPTGCAGDGALELRRFDAAHAKAALAVLEWWISGPVDDRLVVDILDDLTQRFPAKTAGV
jgi:hypothetical protein